MPMLILLSKSSLKDNYSSWVTGLVSNVQIADAYTAGEKSRNKLMDECSGIILTGGGDIDPVLYGNSSSATRCYGIDKSRDSLELRLIEKALERKIPLLAICRGIQMINVYFKGTLIIDLPADYGQTIIHKAANKDVWHQLSLLRNSLLYSLEKSRRHMVNSSHHQAIYRTGNELVPVAWTDDKLIEAVELNPGLQHPFFVGVQWHPERMDPADPLSGGLGKSFLQKAGIAFTSIK